MQADDASAEGSALVALPGTLRSRQAAGDSVHDTADALHCYLRTRGRLQLTGDWLARPLAWRAQCSGPHTEAPDPSQVAAAWTGPAAPQTRSPQPVATRR